MKERKYLDRFRVNASGRKAEYKGEYYAFPGGVREARRRGGRMAAWFIAFWAAMLVHLVNARVTDRCLYALMPLLCALIPAAYGAIGAVSTLLGPARMTVVQRDKGPGRAVRSAAGGMVLAAAGTWAASSGFRSSARGPWRGTRRCCPCLPPLQCTALSAIPAQPGTLPGKSIEPFHI